jgi:Putative lumazine-binding
VSDQTRQTNDADIAAVTDVVRAYYEGTMTGDEAKLAAAFHPRACIVGTWEGKLDWVTLAEYTAECQEAVADAGRFDLQIDGVSFAGDTAHVRLGAQHAGVYYDDNLSLVKEDDTWRIVHKTYYARPA